MWVLVHVGLAAAGLVETNALPDMSTATHNDADGQEIATSAPMPAIGVLFQAGLVAPGLVEVSALPCSSTAAQNEIVGQEMPVIGLKPSIWATFQVGVPAAGLVVIAARPVAYWPATHRDVPTQATVSYPLRPSMSSCRRPGRARGGRVGAAKRPSVVVDCEAERRRGAADRGHRRALLDL